MEGEKFLAAGGPGVVPGRDGELRHRPGLSHGDTAAAGALRQHHRHPRQGLETATARGLPRSAQRADPSGPAGVRGRGDGRCGGRLAACGPRHDRRHHARHGGRERRACCLYLRRQDRHRAGVHGRTEREVQRQTDQRAPARSFLVHRLRARRSAAHCTGGAAGERRRGRERRGAHRPQGAGRLPARRGRQAQAPDMIYAEVSSGSRTRRTLTGAARVLSALQIDGPLVVGLALIAAFGLIVLYSASGQSTATVVRTALRLLLGNLAMLVLARVNPNFLRRWTPWLYAGGCVLLLIVVAIGHVGMGAQRWLNLGLFRFQPSELMKLAVPMTCAWYLHERPLPPGWSSLGALSVLILIPVGLVAIQPDLGTAALIA